MSFFVDQKPVEISKNDSNTSDGIIPGLFEFPENREFPGIQTNFPGIPGNLSKASFP